MRGQSFNRTESMRLIKPQTPTPLQESNTHFVHYLNKLCEPMSSLFVKEEYHSYEDYYIPLSVLALSSLKWPRTHPDEVRTILQSPPGYFAMEIRHTDSVEHCALSVQAIDAEAIGADVPTEPSDALGIVSSTFSLADAVPAILRAFRYFKVERNAALLVGFLPEWVVWAIRSSWAGVFVERVSGAYFSAQDHTLVLPTSGWGARSSESEYHPSPLVQTSPLRSLHRGSGVGRNNAHRSKLLSGSKRLRNFLAFYVHPG